MNTSASTSPLSPAEAMRAGYARLFSPESIAVVGASENPHSVGGTIFANLLRDYPGVLYAINSRRDTVQGHPALSRITDVPGPVDLVIVVTPALEVPALLEECVARGDGSALIISSGFAEAGAEGAAAQLQISELASKTGFPVLGPNCIGFMNGHKKVMANFSLRPEAERPKAGSVALVSQSGGFGSYILAKAVMAGVHVGLFASTGNESDVTVARVLRYFVEQPEVSVLLAFCEATRDPELLLEAADRAVELGKVIVALKTGNSEATARAALSHTASLVGSSEVFDAVCDQYGIVRVNSIEEMVDLGLILQDGRRMRGNRLGVITASGGAGVLVADAASKAGLDVPALPEADQREIAPNMPGFASAINPVDHTAQLLGFPPDSYSKIIGTLIRSEVIDAILPVTWLDQGDHADAIREAYLGGDVPIAPAITLGGAALIAHGVPVYGDPSRAVRALAGLAHISTRPSPEAGRRVVDIDGSRADKARRLLATAHGKPFLLESLAKKILALYGVPVSREIVATNAEQAGAAAVELGGAVVLKILSYELPHKSDAGGVKVGLRGDEAVREGYADLVAEVIRRNPGVTTEGVLVQAMAPADIELMCGLERDPIFGPVVAVGLGGTLVEMLPPPVLLRAPFTPVEAKRAVGRIAGGLISHATRGLDDAQLTLLAKTLVGIGDLSLELPEVTSIDVNPIRVTRSSFVAVDALIVVDWHASGR